MMKALPQNTPVMQRDSSGQRLVYWILCLVIAAAMALAASGSGNPATADPLPEWINTGANLLCILIGALVMYPRTRNWGALAASVMMIASMATNYAVDGSAYALKVLPFNVLTLLISAVVLWHHRDDFCK